MRVELVEVRRVGEGVEWSRGSRKGSGRVGCKTRMGDEAFGNDGVGAIDSGEKTWSRDRGVVRR